jgi:hypothetical protein
MTESQDIQIQKILIEYFKDFDNETMIKIIDSFVYEQSATDNKIGEIIQKFLSDNSLTTAYVNCMLDKTAQYFTRSTNSERQMIDLIKAGFLNLAYNRFRVSTIELKLAKCEIDIAKRGEEIAINELKIEKLNKSIDSIESVKSDIIQKKIIQKKTSRKTKLIDPTKVKFRFDDDTNSDVHVITTLNDNYTLCGILIGGDYTHDVELNSTEKITCQHCLDVINQGKTAKI